MPRTDWKSRCANAGLTMPTLARLTNRGTANLTKQVEVGEISLPIVAAILAYELMEPRQREAWIEEMVKATDELRARAGLPPL